MSPSEREEASKQIAAVPTSINNESPASSSDEVSAGQARQVRNKYLKKIGVGETENSSDCEPLLE